MSCAVFIDQSVGISGQGFPKYLLRLFPVVQLIDIAHNFAVFNARYRNGIGKHFIAGLLGIEAESVVLPRIFEKYIPFP